MTTPTFIALLLCVIPAFFVLGRLFERNAERHDPKHSALLAAERHKTAEAEKSRDIVVGQRNAVMESYRRLQDAHAELTSRAAALHKGTKS